MQLNVLDDLGSHEGVGRKKSSRKALFHAVPHEHWRLDFPAESSEEFRIKQCPEPLPALPSWLVPHLASAGHQQTSAPLLRCSDPHECLNSCNAMFYCVNPSQCFDDISPGRLLREAQFYAGSRPCCRLFLSGPLWLPPLLSPCFFSVAILLMTHKMSSCMLLS